MTTTLTEDRTARPTLTWPGTTALLIGAPLLMAVGRALLVPFDDQDWDGMFTKMAEHQGRSDAGWLLALASCGLLVLTTVLLARRLLLVGKPRLATLSAVATAVGWAGTAGICVGGLFLSEAALAPDRAAQVTLQERFNDGNSSYVFLMCLLGVVGYLVLSVSLARAGAVSKGVAVLLFVGGAGTLATMAGPLTPLLVAAALVLTTAHVLALRSEG